MNSFQLTVFSGIIILTLMAGCSHQDHPMQHQARLKKVYGQLVIEYEKETALLSQKLSEKELETALHKVILIKNDEYNALNSGFFSYNEYANYPYVQYKMVLDHDLYRLSKAIQNSPLAEEQIQVRARTLLKQLREIKNHVITAKEYERERINKAELDAQYALANATKKAAHEAHHIAEAIESTPAQQHHHYHSSPKVIVNINEKKTIIQ